MQLIGHWACFKENLIFFKRKKMRIVRYTKLYWQCRWLILLIHIFKNKTQFAMMASTHALGLNITPHCHFQRQANNKIWGYKSQQMLHSIIFRPSRPRRFGLTTPHSHQPFLDLAAAVDEAPAWTLDQIAGLVFGGLLVAFYFSSQFIDKYVAKSQRRQLGLCEECGGVYSAETCQKSNCPLKK